MLILTWAALATLATAFLSGHRPSLNRRRTSAPPRNEPAADRAPSDARPAAGRKDYFGVLAPYFDRLCRRSVTPVESSVPRTMW